MFFILYSRSLKRSQFSFFLFYIFLIKAFLNRGKGDIFVSVLRLCVFFPSPSRLPNAASPFSAFVVDFPQNGSNAARCVSNCPKEKQDYCFHPSLYLHFYLKTAIWRSQIWKNTIKNRMSADTCPRSNGTGKELLDVCRHQTRVSTYIVYIHIYIYCTILSLMR